jgi:hypothetical protein
VIEDGHTVDGLDGARWRCQHEMALMPPKRVVIDLHPETPGLGGRDLRC